MKKILISGGSGLLGSHLIHFLKSRTIASSMLSRKKRGSAVDSYHWDPEQMTIDSEAFDNCSSIIHLAGAGIADKRWTAERKKQILNSRVRSTNLLFESLKNRTHSIQTIVSASAIGIYGDGAATWKKEETNIDRGFLQDTCVAWENSVRRFEELGIRVVILRIGVVLTPEGGALPQMALPVKLFVGAPLGSGNQFISWIHIDDLTRVFLSAIEESSMSGVYNAVSSNPVSNKEFYQALAAKLGRPLWPIHVPAFLMRLLLGEKSEIVLTGQRVSNDKLLKSGFSFNYETIDQALSRFKI